MLKKITLGTLSLAMMSTMALASQSKSVYKVKDIKYYPVHSKKLLQEIKSNPIFSRTSAKIKNLMKMSNGLYNFQAEARGRAFNFFWDPKRNALFNTPFLIEKNGNVINPPKIVDMKLLKKSIAFTFGNGKYGELYLFTDPQCPFCRQYESQFGKKLQNYKVHVIFFPLSFHRKAEPLTEWILRGKTAKEKYERMKIAMHNPDNPKIGKELGFKHWNDSHYEEELSQYKAERESNKAKKYFKSEHELKTYNTYLAHVNKLVRELNIQGVPTVMDKHFNQINRNQLK